MAKSFRELLNETKASIREIDVQAADHLRREGALLVDVREQDEVDQGMVPGAIHIPRGYLELQIEEKAPDRDRPIAIYCAGGTRSAFAAKALQELGYTDVTSVTGGFNAWKNANLPWGVPKTLTPDQRRRSRVAGRAVPVGGRGRHPRRARCRHG